MAQEKYHLSAGGKKLKVLMTNRKPSGIKEHITLVHHLCDGLHRSIKAGPVPDGHLFR